MSQEEAQVIDEEPEAAPEASGEAGAGDAMDTEQDGAAGDEQSAAGHNEEGAVVSDGEGGGGGAEAAATRTIEDGDSGDTPDDPGHEEDQEEDPIITQRDRLRKIIAEDPVDLPAARAILDALVEKWDNVEVEQIVLGAEHSLGMVVRRLRKHEDEDLATRAGRLYDMYRSEVQATHNAIEEKRRKQKATDKEKSERKKQMSKLAKDKKKSSDKTSERKQKREKKKEEGAEKKKEHKKRAKKRKASSDEDEKSEDPEPAAEEEAPEESPKKKRKKEKKARAKKEGSKKKKKKGDSDDDDDNQEEEQEPDPSDVPARIKFLLSRLIKTADLQTLTTKLCKAHVRESFENGESIVTEYKELIRETIHEETQKRG